MAKQNRKINAPKISGQGSSNKVQPSPKEVSPKEPRETIKGSKTRPLSGRSSIQTFQKAPEPVEVPKQTPKNLASVAHNPGSISNQRRIEAQSNQKPVEDIITAQVTGTDFKSGEIICKDGSGNLMKVQVGSAALQSGPRSGGPAIIPGTSVIVSRSRSQSGERTVRLLSIIPRNLSPNDALSQFSTENINNLCTPSQTATSIVNGGRGPDAPESPETPQVPAPATEPNPNQPDATDPPAKPFGCNPSDYAQWYNGQTCPAGLESLGFAQLPDLSYKTLCRGPNKPPGDGCPETPDEWGWVCNGSSCENVPFGLYISKAECEANCLADEPPDEIPLEVSWTWSITNTYYSGGICSNTNSYAVTGTFTSINNPPTVTAVLGPTIGPPPGGGINGACTDPWGFEIIIDGTNIGNQAPLAGVRSLGSVSVFLTPP